MNKTAFLVQTPSFLNGMARSIDLFASFTGYSASETDAEADAMAFLADWSATMGDLSKACQSIQDMCGKK